MVSAFGEAWNEQFKPRLALKKEFAVEKQRDAAVAAPQGESCQCDRHRYDICFGS